MLGVVGWRLCRAARGLCAALLGFLQTLSSSLLSPSLLL